MTGVTAAGEAAFGADLVTNEAIPTGERWRRGVQGVSQGGVAFGTPAAIRSGRAASAAEQQAAVNAANAATRTRVLEAIAESRAAREASNFGSSARSNASRAKDCKCIDLTDARGRTHILDGDGTGGGHGAGRGIPGKSEFPSGWSDDRVIHEISDIATDPTRIGSSPNRVGYVTTTRSANGIDIKVVYDTVNKRIVTGYPTNLPRNP